MIEDVVPIPGAKSVWIGRKYVLGLVAEADVKPASEEKSDVESAAKP